MHKSVLAHFGGHNIGENKLRGLIRFAVCGLALAGLFVIAPLIATPQTADASAARPSMLVVRGNMEVRALDIAVSHEGAPYVYGAAGPHAFDCSGLTSYSLHHAGFPDVPRTAAEQARFAHHIAKRDLHVGDLIFFQRGGRVYHVAFFDGWHDHHRYIIHAPHTGTHVQRAAIWTSHWFAGTLR